MHFNAVFLVDFQVFGYLYASSPEKASTPHFLCISVTMHLIN